MKARTPGPRAGHATLGGSEPALLLIIPAIHRAQSEPFLERGVYKLSPNGG
jgi:hypothetical protein